MDDVNALASRLAVIKHIRDITATTERDTKTSIAELMEPGDRKRAALEGEQIATVSRAEYKTAEALTVTDPALLLEWVKHNGHDDAIVESLAPWFTAPANLEALVAKTGEVPDGVEVMQKETGGGVSVRQTPAQKEALARLAATGGLARMIADLPQLAGGAQ